MATPDNRTETALGCEPHDQAVCVHISRTLARISDKWSMLIIRVLGRGPCRFNALRREVGEISQKVLASTLRDLEEYGFISRTVTPVNPPQVEYALTELGCEFLQPVRALSEWVMLNTTRMEAARAAFLARRASE